MKSCFLLELFWKKLIFLGLLADFHFSNNPVDIFLSFSSLSLFLAWLFKLLKVLLYLLTDDCQKFIHIWFQVSHGIYHIWLFITQSLTHNFFSSYCHLYVTFIDACFFLFHLDHNVCTCWLCVPQLSGGVQFDQQSTHVTCHVQICHWAHLPRLPRPAARQRTCVACR